MWQLEDDSINLVAYLWRNRESLQLCLERLLSIVVLGLAFSGVLGQAKLAKLEIEIFLLSATVDLVLLSSKEDIIPILNT